MKLYLLTTGCYSDYSVRGVFSSLEKREEAIRLLFLSPADVNDCEEFELDCASVLAEARVKETWRVEMTRDGSVIYASPIDFTHAVSFAYLRVRGYGDAEGGDAEGGAVRLVWEGNVPRGPFAKEHAVKAANERRLQFIASGEWEREEAKYARFQAEHPQLFSRRQIGQAAQAEPAVCSSLPQPDGSAAADEPRR